MSITSERHKEDYFMSCGKSGKPLADCLVIDSHAHIGPMFGFPILSSSIEALIAEMDRIGVDQAYVSGLPALGTADRIGNDIVLDAMNSYPDRKIGTFSVSLIVRHVFSLSFPLDLLPSGPYSAASHCSFHLR